MACLPGNAPPVGTGRSEQMKCRSGLPRLKAQKHHKKQAARQLDTLTGLPEMLGEALSNAFAKDHGRRHA
jgi:hypothetical protein